MSKLTSFLWRWWAALLMMAAIFGFSSIPSAEMPDFGLLDTLVKKGGHALGYGLLALSYLRGLKGNNKIVSSRWLYAAWRMATLYSTTDEFHQSFVTGRHPAATDVLIDSLGAALALLLITLYYKRSQPAITSR
jgi:VanZ family protein